MVTRTVQLGAETFRTRTEALARVRDVLYRHPPYMPIAGADLELCQALLERHPRAVEKIGRGILSIDVRPNPEHPGNVGFWVTRVDGTASDWSYMQCLSPTGHADHVRQALRALVVDQILAFKNSVFDVHPSVPCAITGEPCSRDDCHIDHAPPVFLELANRFAELSGGYPGIALDHGADGRIGRALARADQASEWCRFHREHARLRVVTRRANLSVLRRAGGA